jgi:hypothetical protein
MLGMDTDPRHDAQYAGTLRCLAAAAVCLSALTTRGLADETLWDADRYIAIDEIEPGMEAYCLTDYGEDGIEKFALKVVNVVRDFDPGHDTILVMGLDDRFKHTGVVGGCSGSPVYIDGRLAGALAFGWTFSKDALYGVTPIAEMLDVGTSGGSDGAERPSEPAAFRFDFSKPLDLAQIDAQIAATPLLNAPKAGGATALPCPLLISGLSAAACRQVVPDFESMGFMAVASPSGTPETVGDAPLEPGGVLTLPLVSGDIRMQVMGTVTEVRGDRVYGFGHGYLGYGPVNLPLASGQVYTVVSNVMRSFKVGAAGETIGAITADESSAVVGRIGAKPDVVPLTVTVERYNDAEARTYDCQVADSRVLTASLVRAVVLGAAMRQGVLPPDHTVSYETTIDLDDGQSIRFANVSTGFALAEPTVEIGSTLALLMNNPYQLAELRSIEVDVRIEPRDTSAHLWSVDVANTKVKRGGDIQVEAVVESFLGDKKRYQLNVPVPEDAAPGKYQLMLLGIYEYENYLRKTVPYRFIASNYQILIEALNRALNYDRTRLYCLLVLPPDGIALDRAELPSLPGTKSLVLQNSKRALRVQPYPQWIEKTVETGTVIADKVIIQIVVEP